MQMGNWFARVPLSNFPILEADRARVGAVIKPGFHPIAPQNIVTVFPK